jgi:hypothetical protein
MKNRWVTLDDGRVVPIDEPPLSGKRKKRYMARKAAAKRKVARQRRSASGM